MANRDFDHLPWSERIADEGGHPTPWFQAVWQRMVDAIAGSTGSAYGSGSFASTSGTITIPHGLSAAPALGQCSVQPYAAAAILCTLVSVNATNITARLWLPTTGGLVPDASYNIAWHVIAA